MGGHSGSSTEPSVQVASPLKDLNLDVVNISGEIPPQSKLSRVGVSSIYSDPRQLFLSPCRKEENKEKSHFPESASHNTEDIFRDVFDYGEFKQVSNIRSV